MKRQNVRKLLQMISMLLFPLTLYYFSPALIVQGAINGMVVASAVVFIILFLQAIFFGRAFCSYLCPAGALQDISCGVNNKRAKLGKRVYIKFGIWFVWIAIITLNYIRMKDQLHFEIFYMMDSKISISEPMDFIIYYMIVAILLIPALIWGRRATCHYICWMAPFMILGTKLRDALHLPGLRIRAEKEKCVGCGLCTKECPMSLDVKNMVQTGGIHSMECISCGKCMDQCPKQVLHYTVRPFDEKKEKVKGEGK